MTTIDVNATSADDSPTFDVALTNGKGNKDQENLTNRHTDDDGTTKEMSTTISGQPSNDDKENTTTRDFSSKNRPGPPQDPELTPPRKKLRSLLDCELDNEDDDDNGKDKSTNNDESFNMTQGRQVFGMRVSQFHSDNGLRPPQPSWDSFVRQGSRLKMFLSDAMEHVRLQQQQSRRDDIDDNYTQESTTLPVGPQYERAADLAREKTAEAFELQRQLKRAQTEATALEVSNNQLREEAARSQARYDKTVQALRIAGSNAAKARADADSAEATAATMAQTLQSLQTVVEETKRASQVLHNEQQQVARAAADAQQSLVKKEGDLAAAYQKAKILREANDSLQRENEMFKDDRASLQRRLQDADRRVEELRRTVSEQETMGRARQERAAKIEQEWREAKQLAVQATETQKQGLKTQEALEETVAKLQKATEDMHQQMTMQTEQWSKEKERLNTALTKSEKQVQQLRIEAEASDEELERLRLDKKSSTDQISKLNLRVSGLERRLKETMAVSSTVACSPEGAGSLVSPDPVSGIDKSATKSGNGLAFSLPPLGFGKNKDSMKSTPQTSNDEGSLPDPSTACLCSLCNKTLFGLMQRCQCGKKTCRKKAHNTCVRRIQPSISVSHPGTPAPRLPLLLCSSVNPSQATLANTRTNDTNISDEA